jgi:hypothetical protein
VSIAAAGILSPLICAVLTPVSSITVVLFACGATAWAAKRGGLLNPNAENRKSKEIRNPKSEELLVPADEQNSDFGFPSDFGPRVSDFPKP